LKVFIWFWLQVESYKMTARSKENGQTNRSKKQKMINKNSTPFPTLATERLILRQLFESDVEEIFLLRSDPIINKYLDRQPSKTLEDSLAFIKNIRNNEVLYWAITLASREKLIGTICLFDISEELKKAEIGYELLSDYQGQGIMSEATKKIIDYAYHALGLKTI